MGNINYYIRMSTISTPDSALQRAQEFLSMKDESMALQTL